MGILEAIGNAASTAYHGVVDLGAEVWRTAKAVYIFASSVFDKVGSAWDWMLNGLAWIGDNLVGLAARTWHLLEWLALHAIPEGLSWVLGKAVAWAKGAIHTAQRFLEGALHTLERWTLGELTKLWHWITSEAKRIWHTLAAAWNFIETVGRRAVDLVLHPDKLVAWILGALVLPLVRWLVERSAPIIVWLAKRAVSILPALASTLEDALAKLV